MVVLELSSVQEVGLWGNMLPSDRTSTTIADSIHSLAIALALQQSPVADKSSTTDIHLTDGLAALLPLLRQNVELNIQRSASSNVVVSTHQLSWGETPILSIPQHPDVILAADCAYIEESFPLLVQTLEALMGEKSILWFCYKKRRQRDRDCIKKIGKVFDVQMVKGNWEKEGIWLYEVRRRH